MDLDKLISSRHSIRDYKNKDLSLKLVGEVLDAGRNAPSSGNIQNWRFLVVKNPELRKKISKSCLNQLWIAKAPVIIVICSDNRNIKTLFPKNHKEFSIQNTTIATTLMMLKSAELKLGTCWVAISKPEEISTILKLPDFVSPHSIITLGYPEKTFKKTNRFALETLTYFDGYGFRAKQADTTMFPLSKVAKKLGSKIKKKVRRK